MPIYEYICDNCGHDLEAFQKLSEEPLKTCPNCNQDSLRKKISASGFRLKGGGWYETDFKSGKKKNVAGGDTSGSSAGSESGKSSENKSSKGDSSSSAQSKPSSTSND